MLFGIDLLSVLTPQNLIFIFLGTFVGLLIGAMPGLGTTIAVAFVLPFSYRLKALTAIILLLSVYQGAEYGGSISAITLGIPGTAGAAATVLDGNVMAKQGEPGKAIHYSLMASTIGGIFGAAVLAFLTEPIGKFSLRFSAPDLCMLGVLACFAIIMLTKGNLLKGVSSIVIGLMISTIGTDSLTGALRFTYGNFDLMGGIGTITMIIAIYAIPEMLHLVSTSLQIRYVSDTKNMVSRLSATERLHVAKPILIGSVTGSIVGIFPALGSGVAAWITYLMVKKASKSPETFGQGNPEGIAGPESANNACVGGSLVPLLSLGIPGSSAAAIIGAAFMMFGIQVGPSLFSTAPELLNGVYVGFLIACLVMYVLGRLLTPFFARVLVVRNSVLVPIILLFTCIGVFVAEKAWTNLWLALILGILFYLLRLLGYPLAPLCIAFILGPTIEKNFRRALDLSNGSFGIFWKTTCSKVILVLLLFIVLFPVCRAVFDAVRGRKDSPEKGV